MEDMELLLFLGSICLVGWLAVRWYAPLFSRRVPGPRFLARLAAGLMPLLPLAGILFTLLTCAAFDVVSNPTYIVLYLMLGLGWLVLGLWLMEYTFDLHWREDLRGSNNGPAALLTFAGAFLGMGAIYSGANIGDGPGWWCVIFAAGLAHGIWIVLGILVGHLGGGFRRVTVERDAAAGLRMGAFLLASGLILGRADAGDWTSALMTIAELSAGWAVLPLTLVAFGAECGFGLLDRSAARRAARWPLSVLLALVYLAVGLGFSAWPYYTRALPWLNALPEWLL